MHLSVSFLTTTIGKKKKGKRDQLHDSHSPHRENKSVPKEVNKDCQALRPTKFYCWFFLKVSDFQLRIFAVSPYLVKNSEQMLSGRRVGFLGFSMASLQSSL